jgi:hypothetical protein
MMRCPSTRLITGPLNEVLRDFKPRSEIVITVDVDAVSVL